jgi:hypothetical protein
VTISARPVSTGWSLTKRGALALLLATTVGCEQRRSHEITIIDGASTTRFSTLSEFAEYVELPGDHNELRLTLAGYAASCEKWVPPAEGETAVTVTIVSLPDTPPAVGTYNWSGVPKPDEPLHAGYALPKAHFGARSRLFEPGGSVRLTAAQLDTHGLVAGTLAFEFPGETDRPATRIDGRFEARICGLSVASH